MGLYLVYILITGLLVYDSGKTWITVALARSLASLGYKVALYKPIAGHDMWYQFETVLKSLDLGYLVGSDVLTYKRFFQYIDILSSNPIDVLLAHKDPGKVKLDEYFSPYIQLRSIIMARIYRCSNNELRHFVFEENLDNVIPTLLPWIEKLKNRLNAVKSSIRDFMMLLKSPLIEEELNKCLDIVSENKDIVIIESFNDALLPYSTLRSYIDKVLLVAPGYIAVLNKESYIRAIDESIKLRGEEGLRARYVFEKIEKDLEVYIEPRRSIEELNLDNIVQKILQS